MLTVRIVGLVSTRRLVVRFRVILLRTEPTVFFFELFDVVDHC